MSKGSSGRSGSLDEPAPLAESEVSDEALHAAMYRIRGFEERTARLYRQGLIPGFVHLAIGQEATAVGACFHLEDRDVVISTHRGHGHALARGLTPAEMFGELMGREIGVCRGRGGSMHIADPERGIFGANGIVGAGVPIGAGAAFASQLTETGGVVLAFIGDGAISTGAFHEATNLASLWKLPLVLFCENNGFAEFSRFEDQHPVGLRERAVGYGLDYWEVDGNDVFAVADLMKHVLPGMRAGGGPCLIDAHTYRVGGHYEGDPQKYRAVDGSTGERDPLIWSRSRLLANRSSDAEILALENAIDAELDAAVETATTAPEPEPSALLEGVTVPRRQSPVAPTELVVTGSTASWKTFEAIRHALEAELEEDPTVFLAGIDVGRGGNVFGITRGLYERWPHRLRDTPISETALMGLGVGAAMAGLRPVIELMYMDFLGVCLDQLMNQAAKLPYMTGGRAKMALTVRTQIGAGRSSGAQHSQSLEAMVSHIPGLTVVMPSTPSDTYGLLRASIQDPNPVIFIEHRLMYGTSGARCEPDHLVPIGRAAVRRSGHDLTLVSYSRMAQLAVEAAGVLEAQGISAEVIDLRTIVPLDIETVLASVAKTSRLLIVHEAVSDFGVGAEVAARVAEDGVWDLDAPVMRVGATSVPMPYSKTLEAHALPDRDRIVAAAQRLVRT